jgi:nicotinamidase-related amidase
MPMILPSNAVLILIDLQKAIDHPSWGKRNNPHAEENSANLLNFWRKSNRPIFHIRHNSLDPNSYYRPGQPGNDFKSEVMPLPNEVIITKHTNSAFIGTDLESRLRVANFTTLVIVGVITNNSVETTVRMSGNLGFNTYLVSDATFTFDRIDWRGRHRTAEEVHDMSLANLNGEYCTVVDTVTVLQMAKN